MQEERIYINIMALNDKKRKTVRREQSLRANMGFESLASLEMMKDGGDKGSDNYRILKIPLCSLISNSFQTERDSKRGNIKDLANTIYQIGLINPIVVKESEIEKDHYIIIGGHRRVEAYKLLDAIHPEDYKEIPSILINPKVSDEETIRIAGMLDNIFREPPSIRMIFDNMEYILKGVPNINKQEYKDIHKAIYGEELVRFKKANKVTVVYDALKELNIPSWNPTSVYRYLTILEFAIEDVKESYLKGDISTGLASNISRYKETEQKKIFKIFKEKGVSATNEYISVLEMKEKKEKQSANDSNRTGKIKEDNKKSLAKISKNIQFYVNNKEILQSEDISSLAELETELENILEELRKIKEK